VLRALHERYRDGAVIGGTSAGAAIMSDSMLTGNQVAAGEDTIGYHGDEYPRVARRTIEVVRGLGFLPGTLVDQHFLRRERQNRLLSVVLERPSMIGVGIDEGTAVIVRPDGWWEIAGASSVLVMDARQAEVTPAEAPLLGASGIRMLLLPAGSLYDPRSGRARLPGS
ncbi:cyanophycinase, partial [Longimicrobium sp.]|uniref:cyanophycinase n=1 Tax=Longimicrobium sp. TaxID=2029185 RepID=UPI002E3247A9